MVYREPVEEAYDEETPPDGWFEDEAALPAPEAEESPLVIEEEEKVTPSFKEAELPELPLPEYSIYANTQYQE